MKTTFILHGGENRLDNLNNKKFYQSWVSSFADDYIPKIIIVLYAKKLEEQAEAYQLNSELFSKHTNGQKADLEIASQDINEFCQQVEKADVVYFHGGSPEALNEKIRPIKEKFIDLIRGKICIGSSAGTIMLSRYGRGTEGYWVEGLGLLPIASFVHWDSAFQKDLDEFKEKNKDLEYITLPETEFVIKEFEI